jgi:hypothetical protein
MKTLTESKHNNLSLIKVTLLIFIPTTILTISYSLLGQVFQSIPSLLLFFALATIILFPIELAVVLCSSKKEFGCYSAPFNASKLRNKYIIDVIMKKIQY